MNATFPPLAAAEARRRGHRVVTPEHLLAALLGRPEVRGALGPAADLLAVRVDGWLDGLPVAEGAEPAPGKALERVLQRAAASSEPPSEAGRLLLALVREQDGVGGMLREAGLTAARLAPLAAGMHRVAGEIPEGLARVAWTEAPVPARGEQPAGRWAVVGPEVPGLPLGSPADHLLIGGAGDGPDAVEAAVARAVAAVRALPQGLSRAWFVSRGDAAGAALLALGRVLARERPDLRVTRLRLDPGVPLAPVLAAELPTGDDEVRREGDRRAVPFLERRTGALPAPDPRGGTLLVTGGLGALGLAMARHLAPRFAHVVLVGRSARRRGEADALRRELLGEVDVRVELADAADAGALRAVLDRLPAPLRVVIHAAGVSEDAALATLDEDRLARVLRPKVRGLRALEEALVGHAPERIVLLSSIAGVVGAAGQGAYAAANAVLDHAAESRGGPWRSVAYGPWAGEGMAAGYAHERLGAVPLEPDHGLALLDAALAGEDPFVVAARFTAPPLGASTDLPTIVAEVLAALAPRATVDPDRPLSELGLDSLLMLEARNRLASRTGLRLPPTLLRDHPTPRALAEHLAALRSGAVEPAPEPAPRPTDDDRVAIVGLACRLPGGVRDLDGLAELLRAGRPTFVPIPADRFDADAVHDPAPGTPGRTCARRAALLDDLAAFDPEAFGVPAWEAVWMDPQQRLLLLCAAEALASARRSRAEVRGRPVGVFVGLAELSYAARVPADPSRWPSVLLPGIHAGFAAARVAHALGTTGPSVVVDTACSSGLVALHEAAAALRAGTCELALVGAAQALCSAAGFVTLSQVGLLSPTDAARPFDAAADGTVRGEGCVVLALRRLSDALSDGDPILGVLRGSAVRHAGLAPAPMVPNGAAQEQVMRAALAAAGLAPEQVDLVEAHAVGTPIGDVLETMSVSAVYGAARPAPLLLTSVKPLLGHLDAASGLAGLAAVLAALRHSAVPAQARLERLHPDLRLDGVALVTEPRPWPRGDRPRVAGVSAFSLTGSHAHVLVEEPPVREGELRPAVEPPVFRTARYWLEPEAPTPTAALDTREEIVAFLRDQLRELTGREVTLGEADALAAAGVDSMRAVELRGRLLRAGADVPLQALLTATLGALADVVLASPRARPEAPEAPSAPAPEAQPSLLTHGAAVLVGMGLMLLLLLALRQALPDYAPALPEVEVAPVGR